MEVAVRELAHLCNAEILGGNPEELIHGAANTKDAQPHELTFIAGSKYLGMLATTAASAVLVPAGTPRNGIPAATSLLRVNDPEMAFITCLARLYPGKASQPAVSPQAAVDPSASIGPGTRVDAHASIGANARIGKDCLIHAGCRIGEGVMIGDRCILHPNTVLYEDVVLGDDVIVHAGSVIGADGFGYKLREGRHVKFPQVGTVVIGSQVEIGANTCIDRAALGATRIGDGTKIDNQVHIAHNVQVGQHVLMCGQVGIGGSTSIGDYVVLAAQCGVADHVEIGEQSIVFAQAGVTKGIKARDQVMGYPATSRREYLRETAALRKIAAQYKDVEDLLQLLPQLRNMISDDGAA